MKKMNAVLLILGLIISSTTFSQVTAGDCQDHVNICSDDAFAVDPNGFGNIDELGDGFSTGLISNPTANPGVNGNMGCLMSGELNSTWMVITVSSAGALEFSFGEDDPTGMSFDCYDWIMWPYDPASTCADIQNNILPPVACNWNGACEGFSGMANTLPAGADISNFEAALNVNAGDQFIICFSNFSSAVTNVPLTFYQNPGSAGVSCSPIYVNDETICEGECIDLTANGGSNYTWSPTTGLTPTTGTTVTACPPNPGTWNYVVSGTTPDGPAEDTATVIVLANTDPACSTPCSITGITANVGACVPGNTNEITGTVQYTFPPATGMLIVQDCQGNGDTLLAPFGTQFDFTFNAGADGSNCTITAFFTDDPACTFDIQETYQPPCGCSVDAGADVTICEGDQAILNASGTDTYVWNPGAVPGQTLTVSPTVTTDYIVTGSMNFGCDDTDTVTVIVNPLPAVDAGVDQTICAGDSVIVNGSGAVTYTWDNGIVDGMVFYPATTVEIICQGVDAFGCVNSDTMNITVNPLDDSSFQYDDSVFCITGTDPVVNITGLPGGNFSATPNGLNLDPATGAIVVATSNVGLYTVSYTTNGQCPTTSTYPINVINTSIADFFFDDYCWNETNPSPTFVNGGIGGVFSPNSPDLVIDGATGEINLAASVPGVYTVTNLINIPGCAVGQFQDDVEIFDIPSASISGGGTVCLGDSLPDVQIDLIGTGDWTINYLKDGVAAVINTTVNPHIIDGVDGVFGLALVTDNGTGCSDSIFNQTAVVAVEPIPVIQPIADIIICEGDQVDVPAFISSVVGTTYDWLNTNGVNIGNGLAGAGDMGSFPGMNGTGNSITGTFDVTPTSPFGCIGTTESFSITIIPIPTIDVVVDYTPQCAPATAVFTNNDATSSQTSIWSFGDGNTSLSNGPNSHVYFSDDCFDVSLQVTDSIGCTNSVILDDIVCVEPSPTANFLFDPSITDISDTEISFQNLSEDASSYLWSFGDNGSGSTEENPVYIYPDEPSEYIITLIATNDLGCSDTAYSKIVVRDILLYYVPNAFTPDNDEFNQSFQPVFTSGYDPFDYKLQIFDRWGELLFESHNPNIGWDGRFQGNYVQDGVYLWRLEFKETMTDIRHKKMGSVTIIR